MGRRPRHIGPFGEQVAAMLKAHIDAMPDTQAAIARTAGLDKSVLSRMLSARTPIYLDQLDAICTATGLDVGQLLDDAVRRLTVERELLVDDEAVPFNRAAPSTTSRSR